MAIIKRGFTAGMSECEGRMQKIYAIMERILISADFKLHSLLILFIAFLQESIIKKI